MRIFLISVVILTFVGCGSLPPKTEAIHSALVTDSALRQALDTCVQLGSAEKRYASQEYNAWWQRNRTYVIGANHGILELNWTSVTDDAESSRALLSMQLLEYVIDDAAAQQSEWFGDYAEVEDCSKLFRNVSRGKLDLTENAAILDAYYQRQQSLEADVSAGRSINSRYRQYGRSLFVVEQTLRQASCVDPKIALLRNSWPIEVYDAVCKPEDYLLVVCEWGRCNLRR